MTVDVYGHCIGGFVKEGEFEMSHHGFVEVSERELVEQQRHVSDGVDMAVVVEVGVEECIPRRRGVAPHGSPGKRLRVGGKNLEMSRLARYGAFAGYDGSSRQGQM